MFKTLRILALLAILVLVAFYTKLQKLDAMAWAEPLPLLIYPVNADQSPVTARYILSLQSSDFESIDAFFHRSGQQYALIQPDPVRTQLEAVLEEAPPLPPSSGGNVFGIVWWSLKLRLWVQTHDVVDTSRGVVRMFVLYHDPAFQQSLPHSLGLAEGLIGIVHAFADTQYTAKNNVVIAHELFHTVGASDKYDPSTNEPLFPIGYADPEGERYPQQKAEIMAGRIPIAPGQMRMPDNLRACVVGPGTAQEINWLSELK